MESPLDSLISNLPPMSKKLIQDAIPKESMDKQTASDYSRYNTLHAREEALARFAEALESVVSQPIPGTRSTGNELGYRIIQYRAFNTYYNTYTLLPINAPPI